MRHILLMLAALPLLAADGPKLIYSKSFPGSTPPFVLINVEKDGQVEYREAPDDELPIKGKLNPAETAELFDLSDKLDHFSHPLESGLKVANMGMKTFRYEDGATKNEVKFNYSLDDNAKALLDWFEKIAESSLLRAGLERAVRFDKLGVNESLLHVQAWMERKRLVCREEFLPLLDRIAKNETFLHMARERAASMADTIREGK